MGVGTGVGEVPLNLKVNVCVSPFSVAKTKYWGLTNVYRKQAHETYSQITYS